MALSREAREELTRRQAALSGITKNPLWADQVAEWERKIARMEKSLFAIARNQDGADQRKIDYLRGSIDILRWQINMPNHAEASLLKFLASQGIQVEEEALV